MKAFLVAALCAVASAQDILVYGTMPNPYQILKWDTGSGAISPIGSSMPGYLASPELSAIDYFHMVYYNLVYNVNSSSIQLIGTNLNDGTIFGTVTIPFASGARLGYGESLCVDHHTGNVYVLGPFTSDYSILTWMQVNVQAKTFTKVGVEQQAGTRMWWGSSSTFDSRRNTIWTMVIFNTSGHIEMDMFSVNITTNATNRLAAPFGRFCASLSYDYYTDRIYSSTIQIVGGVVTHYIASFTPSLSFTGWRQANTTGFQPYTMAVAFAHHGNMPPVLFSLALPIGQPPSPTAGPWFVAGFEADTGAFITQHYACRSIYTCPISIEVAEPFNALRAGQKKVVETEGKEGQGALKRL